MPLISAIIIFLNEERFLREAIESVLSQTYTSWELLLIDDGSTDRSGQIAQEYVARMPNRIRYLTHENAQNKGMSASRNLGIAEAKGEYIAYLDGDDVWVPHKLAEQLELAVTHPEAAMVYGPLLDWYSWAEGDNRLSAADASTLLAHADGLYGVGQTGRHPYWDSLVQPPDLLRLFLKDEDYIPSGGLIKRDAIAAAGAYEPTFRGGYSDSVAFVKLCLSQPVWVSSQCWYQYRQHPQSSTALSLLKGEDLAEEYTYLTWVKSYLSAQGVVDPALWHAWDTSFWPHRHPQLYRLKRLVQSGLKVLEEIAIAAGRKILPQPWRHWLWSRWKGSPPTLSPLE